tara:strand:+ start:174 stop:779 length:606 start_codon:yes stop_codon:yes gene_type:complete
MTSLQSTGASATPNVSVGPAGRALAQPMDPVLLDGLQQHLTMERRASAFYFANALWFGERELKGFSKFFHGESQSESTHAASFADYLVARGQTVQLEAIDAPRQSWNSFEEVMAASFLLEADVTASLQQLYSLAERSSDTRTTVFLDPIMEGQIASEHEFAHILGRIRFAGEQAAALLIIDTELANGNNTPYYLGERFSDV